MERSRAIAPEHRPERPLFIFDGDCSFCRRWTRRWQAIAGDAVDFRPFQEVGARYPEIGEQGFRRRAWLILPDGRAIGGARSVLGLYELVGEWNGLVWLYDRVPPIASAFEGAYDLVASHRDIADRITLALWGREPRRPSYQRVRLVLLRALGLIYLIAFASLGVQVEGLIGSNGILPAADLLDAAKQEYGRSAYGRLPTLLWLNDSDAMLRLLCWGGVALGGLVALGAWPRALLALLWAGYLSMVVVGQVFLGYQWDALLLEAGFLGILLAPSGGWLGRSRRAPPRLLIGLFRWLVFRLMFLSGVVKLASGDPMWRTWRALEVHYQTQPLPTWTSWYVHHLPPWCHQLSVGFMFWAELIAPFLIFAPRRLRWVAFGSIVALQVVIAATGNYGFFNLLSIALCLSILEDRDLGRSIDAIASPETRRMPRWTRLTIGTIGAVVILLTTMEALDRTAGPWSFPRPLESIRRIAAPFRSFNAYGLFAVMTTDRPEIIVEGRAHDGDDWRPYRFRWKPGPVDRRPRFCMPHMPRLDWQMWFAALSPDCRSQPWFLMFERRLLEGSPDVLGLLADDPFDGRPPHSIRARLSLYEFSPPGSASWWVREPIGLYCPPLRLNPGERRPPPPR